MSIRSIRLQGRIGASALDGKEYCSLKNGKIGIHGVRADTWVRPYFFPEQYRFKIPCFPCAFPNVGKDANVIECSNVG